MVIYLCIGASKQLGTIIEGESLLNDGAAIVLFNVLLYELVPGQTRSGNSCIVTPTHTAMFNDITFVLMYSIQRLIYLCTSFVWHLVDLRLDM